MILAQHVDNFWNSVDDCYQVQDAVPAFPQLAQTSGSLVGLW